MKRIKKILLMIIPLLILTGCSSNLKCTIKTNNYESTVKIKFVEDKPTTYKYKDAMDFGNTLDADSELYFDNQLTKYRFLIADKFADVIERQSVVKVKVNYDFTKDSSSGEDVLLIKKTDSLGTAKQKIESSGYKCK